MATITVAAGASSAGRVWGDDERAAMAARGGPKTGEDAVLCGIYYAPAGKQLRVFAVATSGGAKVCYPSGSEVVRFGSLDEAIAYGVTECRSTRHLAGYARATGGGRSE
jgi:hypothetical protein